MTKHLAPSPPSDTQITSLVKQQLGVLPIRLVSLRGGAWSSATAVSIPKDELILRFSRSADDFRCDQIAARFSSPTLPIPRVHGIGRIGARWWCISERMPGEHLDELTAEEMKLVLPSIAKMLVAMKSINTSSSTGYGGWDEHGNGTFPTFADQLIDVGTDIPNARGGGWSPVLSQSPYEQSIFEAGMRELEQLCAYVPPHRNLIHQDTINYNVVVKNNQISGVFDWGCAMWGDAVYDLAWFHFWNPWYPQWSELDIPAYLKREVGITGDHAEERMRCYLLHIGLMHIRYNAFIGSVDGMNEIAKATERLL